MNKKITFLSGGLGNQMFQYAFYLSLRERGVNVTLDASGFSEVKMHNGMELEKVFGIQGIKLKYSAIHHLFNRVLLHYKPNVLMFRENIYQYTPEVYTAKQLFLKGNWLNEKYLEPIAEKVKKTFRFRGISEQNSQLAGQMQNENSVSIHIRRGDYLNLPDYNVCDEHYYDEAINHILNNVESPVFYVFSNDPEWCREYFKKYDVDFHIIDWNQGEDSFQDMYLMTRCHHNIIANSTFSWWGAWLNVNEDKIVVSPKRWFRSDFKNLNCKGWQLIENI